MQQQRSPGGEMFVRGLLVLPSSVAHPVRHAEDHQAGNLSPRSRPPHAHPRPSTYASGDLETTVVLSWLWPGPAPAYPLCPGRPASHALSGPVPLGPTPTLRLCPSCHSDSRLLIAAVLMLVAAALLVPGLADPSAAVLVLIHMARLQRVTVAVRRTCRRQRPAKRSTSSPTSERSEEQDSG
jgi:hypothetical protein